MFLSTIKKEKMFILLIHTQSENSNRNKIKSTVVICLRQTIYPDHLGHHLAEIVSSSLIIPRYHLNNKFLKKKKQSLNLPI